MAIMRLKNAVISSIDKIKSVKEIVQSDMEMQKSKEMLIDTGKV